MKLKKTILKKYMNLFSRIDMLDPTWEGYTIARNATTGAEKTSALLTVSEKRYEESLVFPLDLYFRTDLRILLENKDVLEVGSNHGGSSLAYLQLYNPKSIVGIDTSEEKIQISKLFFKAKGVTSNFDFVKGFAEHMPLPSDSFDAIISYNTFEHVADLQAVMSECFRILRSSGKLLAAFPSYHHPTQHHLDSVTLAPCLHWFFSSKDITDAYWEILDENSTYRDKLGLRRRPLHSWERLPIINGMTLRTFRKILAANPCSAVQHIPVPIGSIGKVVENNPILKLVKYISWFGTKLPFLEEITNQRIVYIVTK